MTQVEPILQENKNRFVIFPIKHHDIWNGIRKWKLVFGLLKLIYQDLNDWNNKLSDEERYFVKHIFSILLLRMEL
jgi:ribonucleoside-diphosphate reductase beta chain